MNFNNLKFYTVRMLDQGGLECVIEAEHYQITGIYLIFLIGGKAVRILDPKKTIIIDIESVKNKIRNYE